MEKEKAIQRLNSLENEARELRKIIENSDKPKKITDRIKTVDDALDYLGMNKPSFYLYLGGMPIDTQAYEKLKLVVKALNEGKSDNNYSPYFNKLKKPGCGFYISDYSIWDSCSLVSAHLLLNTVDLAVYCGTQFEQLWYDYIVI